MYRVILPILFFSINSSALGLCVKTPRANLRSGPGLNYKSTWTVGQYMPLLRVDHQKRWSKVKDVDSKTHWIYTNLLTQKVKCLVIKSSTAELRIGPGKGFERANYRSADKYEAFLQLGKKGSWYQVKNNINEIVWVHQSDVWVARQVFKLNF